MEAQTIVTDISEFVTLRDAGGIVEIDEELFYYFLEVLPPAWMSRTVKMPDGREQRTAFGFAEGWENVTAFWTTHPDGRENGETHYYAQLTNPGGCLMPPHNQKEQRNMKTKKEGTKDTRTFLYAVKEFSADGDFRGYTTTAPMGRDEAIANANQHRQWAKDDNSGYTYRVVKMYLTF